MKEQTAGGRRRWGQVGVQWRFLGRVAIFVVTFFFFNIDIIQIVLVIVVTLALQPLELSFLASLFDNGLHLVVVFHHQFGMPFQLVVGNVDNLRPVHASDDIGLELSYDKTTGGIFGPVGSQRLGRSLDPAGGLAHAHLDLVLSGTFTTV